MYAHIYYEHFDQICALGIEGARVLCAGAIALTWPPPAAHLNTNYRHFYLFVTEFQLVDRKDMVPLEDFNKAIQEEYK